MTFSLHRTVFLALFFATQPAAAQCSINVAGTPTTAGASIAFDVVNLTTGVVRITRIDTALSGVDPGEVQIWMVTCGGTMVGKTGQPSLWTRVARFTGVQPAPLPAITVLPPLPYPIDLPPGVTGFYVFCSAALYPSFGIGAGPIGSTVANDGTLEIQAGYRLPGDFPPALPSPVWIGLFSGRFSYSCASPGPPSPAGFQVNQPEASLLVDNAVGGTCSPTRVLRDVYLCSPPSPVTGTVSLSSTLPGSPFDVAFSALPLVRAGAGGVSLPDGQVVNLDLTGPLAFLNGFLGASWPSGTSQVAYAYSVSAQTDASLQALMVDPTTASGVRLSQATELHVNALPVPTSFSQPMTSYDIAALNVTAPPYCWFPGGIPFYGTSYTTIHLYSKGLVTFAASGVLYLAPLPNAFAMQRASAGVWADWDPSAPGASIVATPLGSILRVAYTVPYAGEIAGPMATFDIQIDTANGTISLNGLAGIPPNPQGSTGGSFSPTGDCMLMGISRGIGPATNAGATTFAAGILGTAVNATDMWFDFYSAVNPGPGRCASLVPGTLNSVVFAPSAAFPPNYDWAGF